MNNQDQIERHSELPIFVLWMDFLKWLLCQTEKFPKKSRFTFSNRIDNMALDIVEQIIEARYSKSKFLILRQINIKLEKFRILFRISYESRFLSFESYKYGIKKINEVGQMLGGWLKNRRDFDEANKPSL
ncbi:MAG: diversity-generating retroelement protein Avd [Deltaproteobacteria bacterium]|nr:diversity-generating retroelement protein Avd [Deltaproteobacteria bacterium]